MNYNSISRSSKVFYRYHMAYSDDSFVEEETWRRSFRKWFLGGVRGYVIASVEVILSIIWVALYIKATYEVSGMPTWIQGLNWTFVVAFVCIFAIHLTASENRLRFLLSPFAIIDYLTIIPFFFTTFAGSEFLRLTGILRVFRLLRARALAPSETAKKLLQITLIIICFLFVSSSLLLVVEPAVYYNWWIAFYFVVVTIFTVGFGDITPQTTVGQALVILIILTGVVLIPLQAFALGKILMTKEDPLKTKYKIRTDSKHLVIFGNAFNIPFLTEMINEFAIKYRIQRHIDMNIVIMQKNLTNSELEELCITPMDGQVFVHVLYGSPLKFEDLERAGLKSAECAITIFDNDHDSCLAHMALKSFNRRIAIFSLLLKSENMGLYRTVNTFKENHGEVIPTLLCRLEIGAALLARSVTTRGFSTLISNLIRTRSYVAGQEDKHIEYEQGSAFEIYFGVLPLACSGRSFSEFSFYIYAKHQALLIGLMTDGKYPLMNPGSEYLIKGGEIGIFLASDPSVMVVIKDMAYLPLSRESDDGIFHEDPHQSSELEHVALEGGHGEDDHHHQGSWGPPASQSPRINIKSNKESISHLGTRSTVPMKWDFSHQNPGRIIRYHEALQHPETFGSFYRILDAPRTYRSALITSPPEDGHIIIYGNTIDWVYFIAPLRSRSVSQCQPILIVSPTHLTSQQWASIAHFPAIYVSPCINLIEKSELERLNVPGSTHIIITSIYSPMIDNDSSSSSNKQDEDEWFGDDITEVQSHFVTSRETRDTLLLYSWLKFHCPKTRIIMDLKDEYDLRFLHKYEHSKQPFMQQEVRNGSSACTELAISRLLAQSVYNPFVFDVTMQLIFGTRVSKDNIETDEGDDEDENTQLKPLVRLEQIPSHLKNRTYRELFNELIKERDILPLGLYRQRPRPGKLRKNQYVFTCPPIDTALLPGDRVYVLFPQHLKY